MSGQRHGRFPSGLLHANMINRHAKLAVELVGGLFAAAAVAFAVAAWRLLAGPVPLDALTPYLAASLSNPASGVRVDIAHVQVALGAGLRIELVASGVDLRVGASGPQLALGELTVDLGLGAALRGVIAPTRIVLDRPVLRLARDKDGDFHLGIGTGDAAASEAGLRQVLRDLSGPSDPRVPLGLLRELQVRRADFVFDDAALGVVWRAGPADLDIHRDAAGMRGAVTLAVASGGHASRIAGEVDYVRATGALDARLGFGDLVPAAWAQAAPALAPLAALALPVSGVVRATLDPARAAIVAASCELQLGAGMLRLAQLPGGAVAVTGGTLFAAYDPAAGSVTIERAALGLEGRRLRPAAPSRVSGTACSPAFGRHRSPPRSRSRRATYRLPIWHGSGRPRSRRVCGAGSPSMSATAWRRARRRNSVSTSISRRPKRSRCAGSRARSNIAA